MDEGMPEWSEISGVTDIELTELPDYATIRIAKQVVGGLALPEPLLAYILEKTSGNPLFIQETMRALQAEGLFADEDYDLDQLSETLENLELPDTIHGLVISRIDRLPIESRYILQLASITGVDFSLSFLDGAFNLNQSESATKTRLEQLVEMGVLDIQDVDSNAYRFQHLTTRDVVYDTLPYKDRRRMHNQCGSYLENNLDFTGGERIDLMAFHFFEGQSWEKAIEYNLQAGERAKEIFANESAIDAFNRVLEAVSSSENGKQYQLECCSVREALGEVYTLVGMYDDAMENFQFSLNEICDEHEEKEPWLHTADLSRKIADVYERQSEHDDAFIWINKGLEQIATSKPSLERAKLYLLGAGLYHRKGDNQEAIEWCDYSIADSKSLSSDEAVQAQAQAFYLLGAIEARTGNLTEAVEYCQKSKELYQQINDVLGEARAWNNMGVALTDMGDWNEATQALENSLKINQQIGNIHEEGFGANNLGNIYLYKGNWERALRLFRQSNSIWKRIGALLPDAVTLSNQAQAHIYLKNWTEAEKLLEEAEAMFLEVGTDDFTPEIERRWGELKYKTGNLTAAKNRLVKSLETAEEHNAPLEIGMTSQILGEVLLDLGEIDSGEEKLTDSLNRLIEIESDYEAARARVSLARLRIRQQKFDGAREYLEISKDTFTKSGAEVDLQITLDLLKELEEKI
jgi:tetratricopeptide (TPR) repeat protein